MYKKKKGHVHKKNANRVFPNWRFFIKGYPLIVFAFRNFILFGF